MLKNIRIGTKLILVGTLILVIPLAAVAYVSVTKATAGLTKLNNEQMLARTAEITQIIERFYKDQTAFCLGLAANPDLVAAAVAVEEKGAAKAAKELAKVDELFGVYRENKEVGGDYESVILVSTDGTVVATADQKGTGINLKERAYVQQALAGKVFIGDAVLSKLSGQPITPVGVPVRSGGKVVGVCALVIRVDMLSELVAREKIGRTGYAFVTDRTGLVIAHPVKENVFTLKINETKGMEAIARRMKGGESGAEAYVFNGVAKTAGFAPVPSTGWSVCLTMPDSEFLAAAADVRNLVLVVSAAALLIGFLVYWAFSRTITRPLTKGVHFAELVAAGDFSQQLAIQQRDEVGTLALALNTMSVKLRGMVATIQDNAVQVASSSGQITASAQKLAEGAQSQASTLEETSASVEELTSSVDQVAEHAQSQAAAVEEGSASMAQVRQSIADVSKNLTEIAGLASRSVGNALEGAKAVTEVVEGINLIASSSEKIGGIIGVISDIADQTNLLALNASIEAARAGEHGRGFAVVAEEVSKLADRSSSSTKEIEMLIKESVKNVTKGVETAKGSQLAMEQIRAASQQVKEMITGLSERMEQQVAAVEELAKALANVSEMSQSISAATEEQTTNAKQVSKAVENVNEVTQSAASAAEEMSSATEQLASMAQGLQKMTSQFKIGSDNDEVGLPVSVTPPA
jgi:methyl-accepting chemotaxis protein